MKFDSSLNPRSRTQILVKGLGWRGTDGTFVADCKDHEVYGRRLGKTLALQRLLARVIFDKRV